ncbi:MAG: MerR family transcriptional regulator [Demequinaceae bacterium]|nr:MerR family transcriptional regulator [Demequinaceae bacterium]
MALSDGARAEWRGPEPDSRDVGEPQAAWTGTWPHALSHEPLLRVSDVLAAVQSEFPALTPSKLRFLDSQGLVCPQRTGGGYRHYSPADVERLRFVLRQQRDHYRPLTVIAERLDALDRGEAREGIAPHEVGEEEPLWLAPNELAARAGVEPGLIPRLAAEGIIKEGLPGRFPRADVEVVTAAGEYLATGGGIRGLRAVRHAAAQEAERTRVSVAPLRAKGAQEEALDTFQSRSEAAAGFFSAVLARESCD